MWVTRLVVSIEKLALYIDNGLAQCFEQQLELRPGRVDSPPWGIESFFWISFCPACR